MTGSASERVLVLAPHPDDEILGPGGTIARAADAGDHVTVAIVTRGRPPLFTEEASAVARAEARQAHAILGVRDSIFLEFPAACLDTVPQHELNDAVSRLVVDLAPSTILVSWGGDLHRDHRRVFEAALVAARPNRAVAPHRLLAYETLSETNWSAPGMGAPFVPNVFVDVSGHLERKLRAMAAYRSQLKSAPHERSLDAIRALAACRGAASHVAAAEAFVLVREVVR